MKCFSFTVALICLGYSGFCRQIPSSDTTLELQPGEASEQRGMPLRKGKIVVYNNGKKEEVSIHWHGILLSNRDDGVPHLATAPIKGGNTHLFEFNKNISLSGNYDSDFKWERESLLCTK
ncbi:multicopper oxidase domain-containing protein [Niastella populi]|uniref:Plastocyanin-like domain-containing protein n=1 Tax=Niastella populi TaxID=550983 RepID=A0A1V9EYU4_9BACT|nr:multicopper oxidase domain-containing protein [Niastella populi]OQP51209.1 hypothetical protein A4R26_29800 [Niastella populi]